MGHDLKDKMVFSKEEIKAMDKDTVRDNKMSEEVSSVVMELTSNGERFEMQTLEDIRYVLEVHSQCAGYDVSIENIIRESLNV